jgi:glycerophosphoryl diester phosphodiesterase
VAFRQPAATVHFDLQGHRGARGLWPENTLAGFARTRALGVSTFELDCAVTRDAVAVISHDPQPNPDHTRDAQGQFLERPGPLISTLSYAELRQYDVGRLRPGTAYAAEYPDQQAVDGERIPRLADLFELVAALGDEAIRFNIEAKVFPLHPERTVAPVVFVEALLGEVRRAGLQPRTVIQCFDWRVLHLVQRLAPEIGTGALTDQQGDDDTVCLKSAKASPWFGGLSVHDFGGSVPRLAKASGAQIWSPNYLDLQPGEVVEAHELGLKVTPWTVNQPADMHRILALGVDGLISDRPDRLRAVLQQRGIAVPPVPENA